MEIKRIWIGLIVVMQIVCIQKAFSQAEPVMTVNDAIAMALEYNYDIRLSRNDSSVAALDYSYRNAVFLPRIYANVSNNWTDNDQTQEFVTTGVRTGNVNSANVAAGVSLNWVLFDGLKMFTTRKKAEEYIELGSLVIKEQVINTIAEVVKTYYSIVGQKEQLKAIREQMEISQIRVDLSQRKLDLGLGAKPELLQSQLDLNAFKAAEIREETDILKLKQTLNQLIRPASGTDPGGLIIEYEVSDSIPINLELKLEDIQAELNSQNPSLLITQKNIDLSYLTLKQINADRWPLVQFNGGYNFSRTDNDITVNPFLSLYTKNNGFNYGFSASMPIINYRNISRLANQEKLNISYQNLLLESQQSQLQLSVVNAYKDFEYQKRALELEESNIQLAHDNVNIMLETYRLGNTTYIQLREAQITLAEAYNRLIAARYSAKVAEIELLRLKGEVVQ
ncbi:MAG TPA: TolC family protein [Saprospiraceae bacterium]|nr:TolC family protein [Saprospiraceae bacterium]